MPRSIAIGMFLACLLAVPADQVLGAPPTTTEPDWRLTAGWSHAEAEHAYQDAWGSYQDRSVQDAFETTVYYRCAPGMDIHLQLPLLDSGETVVNGQALNQPPQFFSAMEGGYRVRLLADTGYAPAVDLDTRLSVPCGPSRFHNYVAYLDNAQQPLAPAGQDGPLLTVGGQTSMDLHPFAFSLGLHYQLPTHAAFESGGVQNSVDFGSVLTAEAGWYFTVLPALSFGLEGALISSTATVWRRNGQNVLDAGNVSPEALSLQTHTAAGVYLHDALEGYIGPAATVTLQPGLDLSASCGAGLTPDSGSWRMRLEISQSFGAAPAKSAAGDKNNWPRSSRWLPAGRSGEIQSRLKRADEALAEDDLAAAANAWQDVLRLDSQNPKAAAELRKYRPTLQQRSQQCYLEGMEAYVRNDYRSAIACWQEALRYQPSDAKAKNAIAQTKKKMEKIRQLRTCPREPKPAAQPAPWSTAAEFQ